MWAVCEIIKWSNLIFYESLDTSRSLLTALALSACSTLRLLCSLVKSCSFWQTGAFGTPSLPSDISANVTKLQFMRCNVYSALWYTTYTLWKINDCKNRNTKTHWWIQVGLCINYSQNNMYSIIYIAPYILAKKAKIIFQCFRNLSLF